MKYTCHTQKDFFLGGFSAIVKRDGKVIYRSNNSFSNRKLALRNAKFTAITNGWTTKARAALGRKG